MAETTSVDPFTNATKSVLNDTKDLSKEDVDKWTNVMLECNAIMAKHGVDPTQFIELFTKINEYSPSTNNTEEKQEVSKPQPKDVKVIFLDVDGVINTSSMWPGNMVPLSVEHIQRIGNIIKKTECKIVLSTTWRYMRNKRQKLIIKLNEVGEEMGVSFDVIGRTPYNAKNKLQLSQRAIEIEQYMDKITEKGTYNIISWCALDDMDLTAKDYDWHKKCNQIIQGHFVQTDADVGITDKEAENVIAILNAKC
eukprot:543435_1